MLIVSWMRIETKNSLLILTFAPVCLNYEQHNHKNKEQKGKF